MRERFDFGSRKPLRQIEEHWDALFNDDKEAWPAIRRVHHELMRDDALKRHLRSCFFHELEPAERRGYPFAEESRSRSRMSVLATVLTRIFWQVV